MQEFLTDEHGAVTTDWVVMTAALVGLGLAVSTTLSDGVEHQARAVDGQLHESHILDAFDSVRVQDDFENGRGAWTGGSVRNVPGFGNVLALDAVDDFASIPVTVEGEHEFAVIEFDMIVADSWDNESGTISIGGTDIVGVDHWWADTEGPAVQVFEGTDATVTLTRTSSESGTWGGSGSAAHNDYTYNVRIVKQNDGSDLSLGVGTTLNQGYADEFFGIDNVKVTGSDRPSV